MERDDQSRDLTRLSTKEILELAQGKSTTKKESFWRTIDIAGGGMITVWGVFALLVDPLFLYIPLINEDKKCFTLDPKLKIIALVLRTVIDLRFAVISIWLLCQLFVLGLLCLFLMCCFGWREGTLTIDDGMIYSSKTTAFLTLATFPIPQIAILVFFPEMRGSRYLIDTKVLNSFILLQYVIRAWPVFYYCKNFNKDTLNDKSIDSKDKRWIPCVANFALYILASHVFGALWYFFSILRKMDCWISACGKESGCEFTTFHCDSSIRTTFKNITHVNKLCPINPPDATVFDFGIFLGPIQSGLVGSTDFPQKFLQCFSWGLRNLSSFASNLNTSNYTWEILFVILVSISGLLLFIYLLGHLQTFMLLGTRTYRIRQMVQVLSPEIKFMVSEYGLPDNYEKPIGDLVENGLEKDEDLVVANIFSILPQRFQKHLKRHLFLGTLKKVPGLVNTDQKVLTAIMELLEPASYAGDTYIIREGEPLDKMIFVTQGTLLTYDTTITAGGKTRSSSIIRLAKGDFYGEELITWAASSVPFSDLPISTKTVKSHEKVEVFAIKAATFQRIASEFPTCFDRELSQPTAGTFVVDMLDVISSSKEIVSPYLIQNGEIGDIGLS